MPSLKNYLHLHLIVLIWGFTAILGLYISIPAVELVFYRTLLASILLGIVLAWQRKEVWVGSRTITAMIATGLLIGLHWILFFAAARVANASVCLAGMATSSLWTSFLEPVVYRRSVQGLEIFLGLVVIAGLYVVFHFELDHALGLGMAVGSAMLASLFSVINSRFSVRHDSQIITFYEMIGAFICTVLLFPLYTRFFTTDGQLHLQVTYTDVLCIVILAGICTVYAYSAAVALMRQFSPFAMNLTINLEPVYGILLAFFLIGKKEQMTPGFYLGTLIILFAVLAYPFLNKRFPQKKAIIEG
jgi:drug/metabolite transporter (DMT)-like permease